MDVSVTGLPPGPLTVTTPALSPVEVPVDPVPVVWRRMQLPMETLPPEPAEKPVVCWKTADAKLAVPDPGMVAWETSKNPLLTEFVPKGPLSEEICVPL